MLPRSSKMSMRPSGIEIGALTPEEIAVSITAELIAVRRNAAQNLSHKSVKRSEAPPAPRLTDRCSPPQFSPLVNPSRMGTPKALCCPIAAQTFLEHLIEVTTAPAHRHTKDRAGRGRGKNSQTSCGLDPAHCRYQRRIGKGTAIVHSSRREKPARRRNEGMILCPVDHPLVSAKLGGAIDRRIRFQRESNRPPHL